MSFPVLSDGAEVGRISYKIITKQKPNRDGLEFVPEPWLASPSNWSDMFYQVVVPAVAEEKGLQKYVRAVRGFSGTIWDEPVLTRGNEHQDLKSTVRLLYLSAARYAAIARLPGYATSLGGVVDVVKNLATAQQSLEGKLTELLAR